VQTAIEALGGVGCSQGISDGLCEGAGRSACGGVRFDRAWPSRVARLARRVRRNARCNGGQRRVLEIAVGDLGSGAIARLDPDGSQRMARASRRDTLSPRREGPSAGRDRAR
jgi:hypothetical protein